MCYGCWREDGKPFEDTPRMRAALPLWDRADEFGAMHIVIADNNLGDDSINYCRSETKDPEEVELCDRLLEMTIGERWALYWGGENPDTTPGTTLSSREIP